MANRWGEMETVTDFSFLGSKITVDAHCSHEIKRFLLLGRRAMTNIDSILKNREITFADKCPYSQNYGISSCHILMWELDHEEGWASKNWCFPNVVLEKTLKSPLDSNEVQPVNLKGNQSWIFIGRTEAEAGPIHWPSDVKSWLSGNDPDAWKDWGQEEK